MELERPVFIFIFIRPISSIVTYFTLCSATDKAFFGAKPSQKKYDSLKKQRRRATFAI